MNIPRNFSRNERIYIPELSFPEGDDRMDTVSLLMNKIHQRSVNLLDHILLIV